MSNPGSAVSLIDQFLGSSERFLLLTGTNIFVKHRLAFCRLFEKYPAPATILFRANDLRNARLFLNEVIEIDTPLCPGKQIDIEGGYSLYVDTRAPRTWQSSPPSIDVAIVYPLESFDSDAGDKCVRDLLARRPRKILLVSSGDTRDFGWTTQFKPVQVVYDVPAEGGRGQHPEPPSHSVDDALRHLPEYARSTPPDLLIRIYCDECGQRRWARLNKSYPGPTPLQNAEHGEYVAVCLKCGHAAYDNYKWSRR